MELFDTHCHLDDDCFDEIRGEVIRRASQAGVTRILCVGTTASASQKCVVIASEFPSVFAAVGIQPNHCHDAQASDWQRVEELAVLPRVIALGETGLDRYWNDCPFPIQQDFFDRHLRLSQKIDLPFIVHMRDCDADIVEMLTEARRRGSLRGVMHSFTGSAETARICLDLGLWISFAGMITYKKSDELREVARSIPLNRILIETDSPYLSPHPFRGRRPNQPEWIVHTASALADLRGLSLSEFARHTNENACELFRRLPGQL